MILRSNLVRAVGLVALALLLAYALPAPAQTQPAVWGAAAVAPGIWAWGGPLGGPSVLQAQLDARLGAARPGHAECHVEDVRTELAGVEAAKAGLGAALQFPLLAKFVPLHWASNHRAYLRGEVGD